MATIRETLFGERVLEPHEMSARAAHAAGVVEGAARCVGLVDGRDRVQKKKKPPRCLASAAPRIVVLAFSGESTR
jgi:hypothetical protein